MESKSFKLDLHKITLNARRPLVIRNFPLAWKCVNGSIEEWLKNFDKLSNFKKLPFEQMCRLNGNSPQWERDRKIINITCTEFFNKSSNECNDWFAYNYHRLDDIPKNCREGIDFSCFGFELDEKDYTFWLSSSGANTPCHYDTYGCNIVVQIYGRKSWILFPPETNLTATRIPYEESSVYCSENFYSPKIGTYSSFQNINAFHCILEANDVLIVPKHWWHYVESLDISLSVNAWIPLKDDREAQLEECIVKFIIENCSKNNTLDFRKYVLNPNQIELIAEEEELFDIIKFLISKNGSDVTNKNYSYHYLSEAEFHKIITKLPTNFIAEVSLLSSSDFYKIMESNSKRHDTSIVSLFSSKASLKEILLNSLCAPNVVKLVKNEMINRYSGIKNFN